jgi:hypothetical protein
VGKLAARLEIEEQPFRQLLDEEFLDKNIVLSVEQL